MLELMFEGDFALTKLPKKIEKEELTKVKEAFNQLYPKIKNLYTTLTVESTYPTFSGNDYVVFLNQCNFCAPTLINPEGIKQALLDNILTATSVRSESAKQIEGSKSQTMRFEFLEMIYRLAILVYEPLLKPLKDNIKKKTTHAHSAGRISQAKALTMLFEEYIDPSGFDQANTTMDFREKQLYFSKVSLYFERNQKIFQHMHQPYNIAGKKAMTLDNAIYFIFKIMELEFITERAVKRNYALSKQPVVDFKKNY